MTYWIYDSKFTQFEKALGSKFAAIVYVSKLARHRAKSVDNCITESQAISWVITGVKPANIESYMKEKKRRETADLTYAEDRLLYIEDKEVKEAVRLTITMSREQKHLIYNYNDICDEPRKARVRILSSMIWDEMKRIQVENYISRRSLL